MRLLWSAGLLAALGATIPAGAVPVPGTSGAVDGTGYVDGLAVAPTEGGSSELPGARLSLTFDSAPWHRLRGHVTLQTAVGGPFVGGHPGVLNFVHEFQNRSISLDVDEAYGELDLEQVEIVAGIRKVAWGKLDGLPPTDVVNPRDYHNPLVRDFEEAKVGIPMIGATWYAPDVPRLALSGVRATLLYLPIAVPSRLALIEERWFPPTTTPLSRFVLPRGVTERALRRVLGVDVSLPGDVVIPVDFRTLNNRPPSGFDDGGVGLRLGGTWRNMDWDLYHYTGPDTGPDADLLATLFLDRFTLDPVTKQLTLDLRARALLKQAHDLMHMTGADWTTTLGGASIRVEVAGYQNRVYPRIVSDLVSPAAISRLPLMRISKQLLAHKPAPVPLETLFPSLDAVEWGVGADYPIRGFIPLLQVQQTAFLEHTPGLLVSDPETRFIGSVRRTFLQNRLELELRGVYALTRGGWFVFPRASYRIRSNFRVRLGYLAIGGSRNSLIGQFGQNDEVVMQARYSF